MAFTFSKEHDKKKKKTTCRMICTEYLQNAGRRLQIYKKGKKASTYLGRIKGKKREKEKGIRMQSLFLRENAEHVKESIPWEAT